MRRDDTSATPPRSCRDEMTAWLGSDLSTRPRGWSPRCMSDFARTEVPGNLLHQELPRGCGIRLAFLTGDANPIARLDAGYLSDKGISLLIATVLEFESAGTGESTTVDRVAMMNGVKDADPNSRADGSDSNSDPACLGPGYANLSLRGVGGGDEQGANRGHCEDASVSCCH